MVIKKVAKKGKKVAKKGKKVAKKGKKVAKKGLKAGSKVARTSFEAAIFPLGLSSRVKNAIFNELTRLEDMTGIPGIRLVGGLLVGRPSVSDIMQAVETYSKGTKSKQFTLSKSTMELFDDFIKENTSFPYKNTYANIIWYYQANNPKGAITFENRVYMKPKPSQTSLRDVSLLFHEYMHTCQYYKYGKMVFALVYTGSYVRNLLREPKEAYEQINFEREAYAWDKKFCRWLKSKRLPRFTDECRR